MNNMNYTMIIHEDKNEEFLTEFREEYLEKLSINQVVKNGSYYFYILYLTNASEDRRSLAAFQDRFL